MPSLLEGKLIRQKSDLTIRKGNEGKQITVIYDFEVCVPSSREFIMSYCRKASSRVKIIAILHFYIYIKVTFDEKVSKLG